MMPFIVAATATFGGAGLFPIAPGTVASFVVILACRFALPAAGPVGHNIAWTGAAALLLFVAGVPSSQSFALRLGQKDPSKVVVDEAVGQLIALAGLPVAWTPLLLAFFFFRAFDVLKPWPIRRLERLPGGWGIMMDDVAAGAAAAVATRIALAIL